MASNSAVNGGGSGPEGPQGQELEQNKDIPTDSTSPITTSRSPRTNLSPGTRVRFSVDVETLGGSVDQRGSRIDPPDLSIDTRIANTEPPTRSQEAQIPSTSQRSPSSPHEGPARRTPLKTSRTRDRGYSLRRSLISRNVRSPDQGNGSIIELQPTGGIQDVDQGLSRGGLSISKKTDTAVIVTPTKLDQDGQVLQMASSKGANRLSSLPHYEDWARRRAARSRIIVWIQASYHKARKAVLKISEIPPTKYGRQIQLDSTRQEALIDERTGRPYLHNGIRSSKYSAWNFVPRQLFAQFSKLANFYFLIVSTAQMIPGLSTTGTYTTILPLLFFVSISMAKEGYEDLKRHRLDEAENNSATSVLRAFNSIPASPSNSNGRPSASILPMQWVSTKWHDLRVGDIIRLQRDEAAPADLVILDAQGPNGIAYIETMALDGETNLKSKAASTVLSKGCKTLEGISQCRAHITVEDPNLDLYKFDGKASVASETMPLTNNEIIYRGSILRNVPEAIGVIIYTGEECKIRMNATKNPRIKAPALQAVVNKVVIIIVFFVLSLALFCTIAYQIWSASTERKSWYLAEAHVSFLPIIFSFIIMFNTMIPLSLYVSLEIIKLFQMIQMNDIDMYDEESDTPMEARTSTINEELGQVSYIFSDKTGTLTNNSMLFRKMSVAGTAWLHDTDIEKEAMAKQNQPRIEETPGDKRKSIASVISRKTNGKLASYQRTRDLVQYTQHKPHTKFARRVRVFLLSIALCHTCAPETEENGDVTFQATSPDELALIRAAQELDYMLIDRQSGTLTLRISTQGPDFKPSDETYQILDVIEFSSNRRRMSVIVRMPDNRICIFCKGADSTVTPLLRLSKIAMEKASEVERKARVRKNSEAQEVLRRKSTHESRKSTVIRSSLSIGRPSFSSFGRPSMSPTRLEPIRNGLDNWLAERETDIVMSPTSIDNRKRFSYSSARAPIRRSLSLSMNTSKSQSATYNSLIEGTLPMDDAAIFERCFQHIDEFATEGLRTLLYGHRDVNEEEYDSWKKVYLEASTSLVDRQDKIEKAGNLMERNLELGGATAIEDKLQEGVPEAIEKLRRANIKLWMLTGDKRETAINIGHSCQLIKDYSTMTILDHESGEVNHRIASALLAFSQTEVAHSVVVIDGQTLGLLEADQVSYTLFIDLAILVDSVICCRASPAQKASLVRSIRRRVNGAITLAIGDGANDIAMIQEAHVGIGITGKEGLQAARTSDFSIAQFRFLLKLLLVHGRWNYIRICKYTLGTFWKESMFYLTQALFQRYAGYSGISLYESWSLSMFNTLFTSLPVIFMGIFEKDLRAETLLAIPELYTQGQKNAGFNIKIYLGWIFMASTEALIIFYFMLKLYGQALMTPDNSVYPLGVMTFTACIIIVATKLQFLELHNKTFTCIIALVLSIGGWFLWNVAFSVIYKDNNIYDVKDGLLQRWGRSPLWWFALLLILIAVWALEIGVKCLRMAWRRTDVDIFQELERDEGCWKRIQEAARGEREGIDADTDTDTDAEEADVLGNGDLTEGMRVEEEEVRRKWEEWKVQDSLESPIIRGVGDVRRRHSDREGPTAQGGGYQVLGDGEEGEDEEGRKRKAVRRRSGDVQELLRRGFGSIRRSMDIL